MQVNHFYLFLHKPSFSIKSKLGSKALKKGILIVEFAEDPQIMSNFYDEFIGIH